jgi:fatty acid desaturase
MNIDLTRDRVAHERSSDDFAGNIPVKLTKDELRKLSDLSPLRSTFHIVAEWTLILTAVLFCRRHFNLALYLLTVAFIGARQHAILILMHDGVHYRLFRGRRLNDWTAEVILAWPNLISARSYRRNHFAHHRYLNTAQDPDWARRQGDLSWVFPMHWSRLGWLMLRDISGLGGIYYLMLVRTLLSKDAGVSRGFLAVRYGFYAAVIASFAWFGALHLLLMYWIVPLFTWLIVIFRIRSIAEHSAIDGRASAYAQTRSTHASVLEHVFVAPKNVNYHIEHHFYPSVPFYRLPELHRLLMSKSEFKESVHVTRSYFGVLRECLGEAHSSASGLRQILRMRPSRAQA